MDFPSSRPIVHLLANSKSGKGLGESIQAKVGALCEELGHELVVHEVGSPEDLEGRAKEAVARAAKDGGVVMAAGGDGTIRTVAEHARGSGARFAVIPCGTFNYFARTHRIPEDLSEAIRLGLSGECRPVRLGEMNGRAFLINASLGIYAESIHEREKNTSRWGRRRVVAIYSTLHTFLSDHRLLKVSLQTGEQQVQMRTPMIFIGNNALQLRNLKMDVVRCMRADLLALVALKPLSFWEKIRVIFRGAMGSIESEERLDATCVDSITIHSHPRRQTVALDGELFSMQSPFEIRAVPETLRLMLPPREASK